MSDERSYRGEFLKSPHHAWFGLLTLGSGFLSAQPLLFLAGLTAYAIGWVYLPDLPLFRGWVNRREAEAHRQVEQAKVNQFLRRRDAILSSLAQDRLQRYQTLADVCQNIETASAESATASEPEADPRLRKLDELMWTYLRLLSIEESLENFVATEEREKLPTLVQQAEGEIAQLHAEHKKIE